VTGKDFSFYGSVRNARTEEAEVKRYAWGSARCSLALFLGKEEGELPKKRVE